ncbi:MAG: ATP-binding protein [Candidatus Nanohaloarchaea archaeon]
MEFLNREAELETLNSIYEKGGFLPIYGRRRIGKTRLIQEFFSDKKGVYYLAAQEPEGQQVEEFKNLMAEHLEDDFLEESDISDWKQLFNYLEQNMDTENKRSIIIDEVTYIIKRSESFPSYLQKFWDGFLKDSDTSLILSGSLIGLMKESILNRSSPVYGRRSAQINLRPLEINHLQHLFDGFEKTIKVYSVLGGVPKYYEEANYSYDFSEMINEMLEPDSFFFEEGFFLLSQEFKELGQYNAILRSISQGQHEAPEIANDIGMDNRQIYNYLDKLYEIGLVERQKPVTKEGSGRGQRYYVKDHFTRFWFKTIFPERSRIQSRKTGFRHVKKKVKHLTGQTFEELSREATAKQGEYQKTGRWWYREDEIDVVALNEESERILFGEAKWTNQKVGMKMLTDLEEKSQKVRWHDQESRNEEYALFSKNGFRDDLKREAEQREDLALYNLDEIFDVLAGAR